jgi:hypothetical protein
MGSLLERGARQTRAANLTLRCMVVAALGAFACGDDEAPKPSLDAGLGSATISDGAISPMDSAVPLDASLALNFTPTWHEHVAPILSEKCSSCHKDNGIGPFSMKEYASTKKFADLMVDAVESGRMPPFLALETPECVPRNKFANDTRLTPYQLSVLRAWAAADAPEGDRARAATLPPPPATELAREDVVMPLPAPIVVERNSKGDIHTCVIVDPRLTKDEYVVGRQITAGNAKVLHHVVTYVVQPKRTDGTAVSKAEMDTQLRATKGAGIGERYDCFGGPALDKTGLAFEMLGAWAPGATPTGSPPDSGQPISKDSLVVLDVHYHPLASGPETDSATKLSLQLAEGIPKQIAKPILLGNFEGRKDFAPGTGDLVKQPDEAAAEFLIPAGKKNHVEEMTWTWKLPLAPLRVYFAGTHMHYVGRDLQVTLENTTPAAGELASECLVRTPKWDFNWQNGYSYDASFEQLPVMNDGDVLRIRCVYDNTMENPFLAKALEDQGKTSPVDVRLGEDTLDEMCLASIGIVYPNAAAAP